MKNQKKKPTENKKSIFEKDKTERLTALQLAKKQEIEKLKTHHWVTDGKTSKLTKI